MGKNRDHQWNRGKKKKSTSEIKRDITLLQKLNNASAILQRSTHDEHEFFRVFHTLILSLGFQGLISLFNETNTLLTIKSAALSPDINQSLEKAVDFTLTGFSFSPNNVQTFKDVLKNRKTIFKLNSLDIISQFIPEKINVTDKNNLDNFANTPAIFTPLVSTNKIIGVLSIMSKNLEKSDIPVMEFFAHNIAFTLDNLYLRIKFKENEQKLISQTEDLRLINELNAALNIGKPLYKIFSLLAQETCRIFKCKGIAIYLLDPNKNELVLQDTQPGSIIALNIKQLTNMNIQNLKIKIRSGNIYDKLLKKKIPHLIQTPEQIREYVDGYIESIEFLDKSVSRNLKDFLLQITGIMNILSIFVFPMVAGDDDIGIIEVFQEDKFSEAEINRLKIISGQLTTAVKRKQNEEELQKLIHAIKQSPSMIVITDTSGNIEFINSKFTEVTGYKFKEVYGKHVRLLKSGKTPSSLYKKLWKTITSGKEWRGEFYNKKKNNKLYWEEANISPIRNRNGEIIHYLAVKNDITEKKKIEEELFKARKLDSIGILAGGIAHDFNNMLSSILGNINLAKLHIEKYDEELNSLLNDAETASLNAKDLTQQLLTFSLGGSPVKKPVSLIHLINENVRFTLRGSNVRWKFEYPDNLWFVEIDKGQMNQVINNLVINADQAMEDGGLFFVSAKNAYIDDNFYLPLEKGRYVILSFEDNGKGIPEQHISKIFDPYFTTKENGTGLGLATAYSIIKKHGGIIQVESTLHAGTSFFIYLPATDKQECEIKEKKNFIIPGSARVLLMDDETLVRKVAAKMLRRFGYSVTEVADGKNAMEEYKKKKDTTECYDLIIMDLTIPNGIGGKEAIKQLRNIDKDIKVIVSSGYSNDPIMAEYRKYGFNGRVKKPFKLDDLIETLKNIFSDEDAPQ